MKRGAVGGVIKDREGLPSTHPGWAGREEKETRGAIEIKQPP